MKLYKFRSLQTCNDFERILDILKNGFYCSNFLLFNDMHEGVFLYENSKALLDKELKNILSEKLTYKICSFSQEEALSSQLTWGHYAGAGMGVAIEFEVDDPKVDDLENDNLYKVRYQDSLQHAMDIKKSEDVFKTKSLEWEYEKEFRFIKKMDEEFYKPKISKILFGTPYKKLSNYNDIKEKHEKLKKYLHYKELIECICKEENIETDEYDFKKLDQVSQQHTNASQD